MPVVQMPDGTRVRFPDDMPPDQIRDLISQKFPQETSATVGPSAPAPVEQPPSEQGPERRSYADSFGIGLQAVGEGLADIVGAPVDLATGALNLIPGVNIAEPFMGSESIKGAAGAVGDLLGIEGYSQDDMSPAERLTYGATRFGTQAIVPAAGLTAAAGRQAATRGGQMMQSLAKPYEKGVGAIAGDVGAGLGAGVADSAIDTYAEDTIADTPLGRILAATIGGVGGATGANIVTGAAEGVGNMGRNLIRGADPNAPVVDPTTGKRASRSQMDTAARIAQDIPTDRTKSIDNIRRGANEFADADYGPKGSMPTTGMLADDIGFAFDENAARGKDAVPFAQRDAIRRAAASDNIDQSVPAGANGENLRTAARTKAEQYLDDANRGVDDVADQQAKLRVDIAEENAGFSNARKDRGAASAELADEFKREYTDYRNLKNDWYDAVPDRAPVDGRRMASAIARVDNAVPEAAKRGTPYQKIRDKVAGLLVDGDGGVKDITYGDIKALNAEISGMRAEIVAAGGDVSYLDRLRNVIRTTLEETNPDAARFYKDEFAPRFKTGQAGAEVSRIKRANKTGEVSATARDEDFGNRFLKKPTDAKQLDTAIGVNEKPQTLDAARRYLLGDLADSGIMTENPQRRAAAMQKWMETNSDVVDQFPELRTEFNRELNRIRSQGRQSVDLDNRMREAKVARDRQRRDVNSGPLAKFFGNTPSNAVKEVMNSGDPETMMGKLVDELGGDLDAIDGLKAATRDWIMENAETTAVLPGQDDIRKVSRASLEKLMRKHDKVLARIYSPEEMNALQRARKLLNVEARMEARATAGSQTMDKATAAAKQEAERRWRMLEGGLKAKFGVLKGGGILRTLRVFASTLPEGTDGVRQVLHQMYFDPDLAVHLLERPVKEIGTPGWNAKLNRLLALGAGAREMNEDDGRFAIDVLRDYGTE